MSRHSLSPRDYLAHMLDAATQIQAYVQDKSPQDFLASRLIQDGVVRNIEILEKLPGTFSMRFRMQPCGFPVFPSPPSMGCATRLRTATSPSILTWCGKWLCAIFRPCGRNWRWQSRGWIFHRPDGGRDHRGQGAAVEGTAHPGGAEELDSGPRREPGSSEDKRPGIY